ncbi:hypothetical protein [Saccharospirillum alexandrii]|uniref:hypothetical protein n=1 Tax=Saccharospirillum alexandrii TaxID=2448477 RepID=UPI000FDA9240|nr:hypothetical protein [Saccharospirillum alexandrii]
MTEKKAVSSLLDELDGSGSENEMNATNELRKLGNQLPKMLLEKYREARKWQVRSSCVYHSIRYTRSSAEAVQLGLEALYDKSHVVRYRACMLLACSLEINALASLKKAEKSTLHEETLLDINAAIDAIENENSNYFVDREHSGKMILRVN